MNRLGFLHKLSGGDLAILGCVVTACFGLLFSSNTSAGRKTSSPSDLAITLAGITVYLILNLVGTRQLGHHPIKWQILAYFATQLLLCLFLLIITNFTDGIWVLLMPVAAQGVVLLSRRELVILCLGMISVMIGSILSLGGTWEAALRGGMSFCAGLVFVTIFTQLAVNATKAQAEVQRLATELEKANQKLRQYAIQVEELATTKERNRLAREIHDSLGHYLTVINIQLEAARVVIGTDPSLALEALGKAQTLTKEGLGEVRHSVAALRASPLETSSLVEAIARLVQESCNAGIITEFKLEGEATKLSSPLELTLYRAAQEGLTNMRKHSLASQADLALDYSDSSKVRLLISDNGQGTDEMEGGFGLLGLRERVQLLNGTTLLRSAPGQGFHLELELPR
ncbi:MAG: sensor histidine kinase [Chloroflexota bacterium]|nr:sensor histidine kinase [Chloroflexota bacterium]